MGPRRHRPRGGRVAAAGDVRRVGNRSDRHPAPAVQSPDRGPPGDLRPHPCRAQTGRVPTPQRGRGRLPDQGERGQSPARRHARRGRGRGAPDRRPGRGRGHPHLGGGVSPGPVLRGIPPHARHLPGDPRRQDDDHPVDRQPAPAPPHRRPRRQPALTASDHATPREQDGRQMSPRTASRWLLGVALIGLLAWTATTSIVTVGVGEALVVRRFGAALSPPLEPGLHLGLPWGLDDRARVRLDSMRTIEIGLSGSPGPGDAPDLGEYLAGDENMVLARGVVQYRVADARDYALAAEEPEELLRRSAESALSRAFAGRSTEEILRTGRLATASAARASLSADLARLRIGVEILAFNLVDARPPAEVAEDFNAAQSAASERDRLLREAEGLAETTRIAADAQATARLDAAKADAARIVADAHGQAQRFLSLLPELRARREFLIRRLLAVSLRESLPRVLRKVVTTGGEPVDLGLIRPAP